MIRLHIKDPDRKVDRQWFRWQWKKTPFVIRQNLYINLVRDEDTWRLDFAVPMLEAAAKRSKDKEANTELSSSATVIETDFITNVRKELEKKGLTVDDVEYGLKAPESKAIQKLKGIFGRF